MQIPGAPQGFVPPISPNCNNGPCNKLLTAEDLHHYFTRSYMPKVGPGVTVATSLLCKGCANAHGIHQDEPLPPPAPPVDPEAPVYTKDNPPPGPPPPAPPVPPANGPNPPTH